MKRLVSNYHKIKLYSKVWGGVRYCVLYKNKYSKYSVPDKSILFKHYIIFFFDLKGTGVYIII